MRLHLLTVFHVLFLSMILALIVGGLDAKAAIRPESFKPDPIQVSSRPVVVAVIDTGLDLEALSRSDVLWTNAGEVGLDSQGRSKSVNGVDDDGNGYIDDVHGVDFTRPGRQVGLAPDRDGHGTHIAHLILQQAEAVMRSPASQGAEVHQRRPVRLMVLKYYSVLSSGEKNLERSNRALAYALDNGAQVVNFSGGGRVPDEQERRLLLSARKKGVVVVAAAGNEGLNTDRQGFYPASYGFPHVLSVAALGEDSHLFRMSNYSSTQLMVAAPGEKVMGPVPGGQAKMTGTSQATAITTGVLVGLMSHSFLMRSPEKWIELLLEATEVEPSLKDKLKFPLKVNLQRAQEVVATLPARDHLMRGATGRQNEPGFAN